MWRFSRHKTLKETAVDIDKKSARRNLPWLPEGRCDSFTKGAILVFAPPTSGVYGLFNSECQVFIGEASNIQEALLRLESQVDFRFQRLRPTGFTFEPCVVEVRKSRADELVARFSPVLQTKTVLNRGLAGINQIKGYRPGLGCCGEAKSKPDEFPLHENERPIGLGRNFRFKWTHATPLVAIFVATVGAVVYPDMPFDYVIQKRATGANASSGQAEISLKPQDVASIDAKNSITNESAEPILARAESHASDSTSNIAAVSATDSIPDADQERTKVNTSPRVHSLGNIQLGKKWSVQVAATPARDIADSLVQRLKAKGYDGYVVQTEVKGQTYYRVRVGYFDSRQDAESVHQSLMRQEGYRDAYPTRN